MNFRKPQPIRLVIVDDHPVLREGLRRWFETEPDLKVVGEASNTAEAMKLVRELKPDILLTDLCRPKDSGFETLRELNTLSSSSSIQLNIVRRALSLVKRLAGANATAVRVIVLTAAIEKSQIVEAFQLGASGVVLKDSATQVLIEAIRRVRDGEYWVHREPVSNLKRYLRTLMQSIEEVRQKKFSLTPRELEIVSAVVEGYSNKEIAEYLKIDEDTVKRHLINIFDKVGVSSRVDLALFAVNEGIPLKSIEEPQSIEEPLARSQVKFREDRDGNVIAFEYCGCEADADSFRPCQMHQTDDQRGTRLKAEARYHSIQTGSLGPHT